MPDLTQQFPPATQPKKATSSCHTSKILIHYERSEGQSQAGDSLQSWNVRTGRWLVPKLPEAVILIPERLVKKVVHAQARKSATIWKTPAYRGIDNEKVVMPVR